MGDFLNWLQHHLLICPSVKWLHMQCPGCGMQRSLLLLFHGRVSDSLAMHPAAIPLLTLLVFLPLHLAFKFRSGAAVVIILQATVAILSLGLYVYKIIHHQIFV